MITDEQIEALYTLAGTMMKKMSTWPPMEPRKAFDSAVRARHIRCHYLSREHMMAIDCLMLMIAASGEWPPVSPSVFASLEDGFQSSDAAEAFAVCAKALWPDKETMN